MSKKETTISPKYNPERFKEVLKLLNLTQTDIADELNMRQPTFSAILSGKSKDISITIREHLRKKYNINTDYFYELSNEVYLTNTKELLQKKIEHLEKKIKQQNQIIELQFDEIEKLRLKRKK